MGVVLEDERVLALLSLLLVRGAWGFLSLELCCASKLLR